MSVRDNIYTGGFSERGILYFQAPFFTNNDIPHVEFINKDISKLYLIYIGGSKSSVPFVEVQSTTAAEKDIVNIYSSTTLTTEALLIKEITDLKRGDKITFKASTTNVHGNGASMIMMIEAIDISYATSEENTRVEKTYTNTGINKTVYAIANTDYGVTMELDISCSNPDASEEIIYSNLAGATSGTIIKKYSHLNNGDTIDGTAVSTTGPKATCVIFVEV